MMRKIVALDAVLFVGLIWTALPVLAQSQGQYTPPATQYTPPATQYTPPATSTPPPPGASQQPPGAWQQQNHRGGIQSSRYAAQATGEVTKIDHQTGKLTLKTVDREVNATFPPAAVQNVRQGDNVSVAIGLVDTSSPSASPRTR